MSVDGRLPEADKSVWVLRVGSREVSVRRWSLMMRNVPLAGTRRRWVCGRLGRSVVLLGCVAVQALAGSLWETDFAEAATNAKAASRYLLLDFSGSDWCGFCMRLDAEVFGRKPFKQYAEENLVCVLLDFPRQRALRNSLKEQNEDLKKKYGVGGYPTVIVLSPDGEVLMQKSGYKSGTADEYLEGLKTAVRDHREKNHVPAPVAIQTRQPRSAALPAPAAASPKAVPRDDSREMRAWTSKTGASVTASLVEEKGSCVILRKESGVQVQIATDSLTAEDQQYIASLKPEAAGGGVTPKEPP
jgi:protein disulfide-isomerase